MQACKGKPQLGRVMKVALPGTRAGCSISPQRRIQGVEGGPGRPLQRYGFSLLENQHTVQM